MHERLISELRFSGNEFKDLLRMGHICEIMLQAADAIEGLERENEKLHADIADVRPVVRAHWYWDKDGMDWGIGAWRCSACRTMSPMWWNCDKGSPMHKSGHRFCPNCGADMRPTSMSGANGEENEGRTD